MTDEATAFWEARYADADRVWSGRVNPVLAEVAARLEPGRALDVGCGEGGDAVWLARHGWTVTGVDLSSTAIHRGRAAVAAADIRAGAVRLEAVDLLSWSPEHDFDLVSASFLQSWPVGIPRDDLLRRASELVAPGGHLLVVAHAAAPSWADAEIARTHGFPSPEEDLATLRLDPERWRTLACERRERAVTAPDGSPATLVDGVVLARRDR